MDPALEKQVPSDKDRFKSRGTVTSLSLSRGAPVGADGGKGD